MPSILQVRGRWRAQVRRHGQSTSRSFDTRCEAVESATQVEATWPRQGPSGPHGLRLIGGPRGTGISYRE